MKSKFSFNLALHFSAVVASLIVLVLAWLQAKDLLNARSDKSVWLGVVLVAASILFVACAVYAGVNAALRGSHQDLENQVTGKLRAQELNTVGKQKTISDEAVRFPVRAARIGSPVDAEACQPGNERRLMNQPHGENKERLNASSNFIKRESVKKDL